MIESVIEKVSEIIKKLSFDIWLYIAVGVIAVVFIIGLVLVLISGELVRFKGGVNVFKKLSTSKTDKKAPLNFTNEAAKASALAMPIKVKKLYKYAKSTHSKPSDIIGVDSCVFVPYYQSFAAKFAKVMIFATIVMTALIMCVSAVIYGELTAIVFTASLVTIIIGAIFTVISAVVSSSILKGGLKAFNFYVEALDGLNKGGKEIVEETSIELDEGNDNGVNYSGNVTGDDDNSFSANTEQNDFVIETYNPESVTDVDQKIEEKISASFNSGFNNENSFTENREFPIDDDFMNERTKITVELADEEEIPTTTINSEPVESEEEIRARARAEAMARAREEQAKAQQAREEQLKAQRDAQLKEDQERRAAETRARMAQAAQARSEQTTTAAAAQNVELPKSNVEDVIARIEKINKEGAPLATMKEVALLLQQERAKPENKTPEQQRKLNEALASLLKSMSAANRK